MDERYVVARVFRPVCLRQLGSIPSSGVKLFSPLKFLPSKAALFSLLTNRKSFAIFVHLRLTFWLLDSVDSLGLKN